MTSRFEHSERANYLVLAAKQREEKMADHMLLQNEIKGLLPIKMEQINGCKEYYYDISSKHSLGSVVKKGTLNAKKIRFLIESIGKLLEQFHEYMLDTDGICLSEELIYTELPEWKLFFCYFEEEGKQFSESLRKLLQFVIEYVDYKDKEAVKIAYACYQAAMQENFTFTEIEACFDKSKAEKDDIEEQLNYKSKTVQNGYTDRYESSDNRGLDDKESRDLKNKDLNKTLKIGSMAEKESEVVKSSAKRRKEESYSSDIRLVTEPRIQSEVMEEEAEESIYKEGKAKRISCCIIGAGILLTGGLWFVAEEGLFFIPGISNEILPYIMLAIGLGFTAVIFLIFCFKKRKWMENTKLVTKEVVCPYDKKQMKERFEDQEQKENRKKQKEEGQREDEQKEEPVIEKTVLLGYCAEEEHRELFSCQKEFPSIEITEYPFSIGKISSLNQGVIFHEGISRMHCKIQKEKEGYTITDLNSTNGVIVNGQRLMPNETRTLPLESEVKLGILLYIFR